MQNASISSCFIARAIILAKKTNTLSRKSPKAKPFRFILSKNDIIKSVHSFNSIIERSMPIAGNVRKQLSTAQSGHGFSRIANNTKENPTLGAPHVA